MSSVLLDAAQLCREGADVPPVMMVEAARHLVDGSINEDPKRDFLVTLSDRGERAGDLLAFSAALLPQALDPRIRHQWNGARIMDCCGTGGGGLNLINFSTGMMFVLSACGVPVVKHGNRGVTKASGSADVLSALGIPIDLPPESVPNLLEACGMAFLLAPQYHPAFACIAPLRKALASEKRRTIFNLLGPLLNPAQPGAQLTGVFKLEHIDLFHAVLMARNTRHAVVFGQDRNGHPMGEVSPQGLNDFKSDVIDALEFDGIVQPSAGGVGPLLVRSADESAARLLKLLKGEELGLGRELLLANTAAALLVHGTAETLEQGWAMAAEAVDSGLAIQQLERMKAFVA